ncbi:hypothetical protein [Vibrio atypicus]|uniref:hypothetical protein n=1 Tax=Vibrio atypicus TaxID=558271 RepID=UPI00135C95C4|nr:hypothetical protein [Vibrio atypicus]
MNKLSILYFFVWVASFSAYAENEARYSSMEEAWLECKGYEETKVIAYDDGHFETICSVKEYNEISTDLTAKFAEMYMLCDASEQEFCLESAKYYEKQNTTFVTIKLSLSSQIDKISAKNSSIARDTVTEEFSVDIAENVLFTLNPQIGKNHQIEFDYSEIIALIDSPYSLDTVAVGLVVMDNEKRFAGYAAMEAERGVFIYSFEKNSFALPHQLMFYPCDFSTKCTRTVTIK